MADTKITGLTNFDSSNTPYWPPAPASDVIPIVDISDNTMAASGTTKKISINNLLSSSPTASGALTVTGLVTAGSATITGAATVGTTLGVTGQLSTADVLKTTGNPGLSAAGATEAFVAHNTGYGAILYGQGTTCDAALLDRNTGLRLTVTTSGAQVSGDLTVSTGNVVMATSGKGIDFSAVTGGTGTATANVLNDYEEGTWTGTLNGSVSNPATLLSTTGKYTKIGRTVTAQVFFSNINTTGYSGRISISGLPFANGTVETVATAGFYGAATFTGSIFGLCTASGTAIVMYSSVSGSAFADVTFNPGSVQYIWANISYNV